MQLLILFNVNSSNGTESQLAEGLDGALGGSKSSGGGEDLAPGIVDIFYHFIASTVNDTDNIPLQIMQIGILYCKYDEILFKGH